MLRPYLQLFRISNIFTVPSDIFAGYFTIAVNSQSTNFLNILFLLSSSIFLYIGGMITNDLFDINIDKIERPTRPLPSGKIKISVTIGLSILFLGSGILLASFLSVTSFVISILMTIGILSYNYKIKNGIFRPFLMGGIRSLNIFFGASTVFDFNIFKTGDTFFNSFSIYSLYLSSFAVFCHIFILTTLSSRETDSNNKKEIVRYLKRYNLFHLAVFTIVLIVGIILIPLKFTFLLFLISYIILILLIFYIAYNSKEGKFNEIQFIVKNMIILLILLNSSFIAGSVGILAGLLFLCLIPPCILVGKRIQMT